MHKVRGNYSSCTGRSSENICGSSGGGQEKGKRCQNRMKLSSVQRMVHFWVSPENICSSSGGAQEKGKRGENRNETQCSGAMFSWLHRKL
jgi:hypothetical protein